MPKKVKAPPKPVPRGKQRVKRRAGSAPARPRGNEISFCTPTAQFSFDVPAKEQAQWTRELQRAAMQWIYIVRNRQRWSALPGSAKKQAERAGKLLVDQLRLSAAHLQTIAEDRLVEVVVPFSSEEKAWEARIFPWEYVLAGATREMRNGEPLTVVRRLEAARPVPGPRAPRRVLYVESAPGKLRELYTFDTERDLVKSNLKVNEENWKKLTTPTLEELARTVREFRPDIVHLAGFDSHQGFQLLDADSDRSLDDLDTPKYERSVDDGYLLADSKGRPKPANAEALAQALCPGPHRPVLVALSMQNSAGRIAPMAVSQGAAAAIGLQDAFDDDLVELFFGTFYRKWRRSGWRLPEAFRDSWETVRKQASSVAGTGLVLWSAHPLVQKATVRLQREERPLWLPSKVPPDQAHLVLAQNIKVFPELNYSLLHNRQPLFESFTLVNSSASYDKNDAMAELADVDIRVELSVGAETASYQRRLVLDESSVELRDKIHVPLTSELMRSVHESINSALSVEVSWGRVLYRDTHLVRLLPVDQWRDNDKDGQWLPSFVLPRDAAIGALIEKAQRYVRVLRDDPSAGFDGYQSLDPQAPEPTLEVDRQVQAIWSMLVHELDLGYINPPPGYNDVMDAQRLRTPTMIVDGRVGTCLDLTLLVCACLELVDIYPVIFLLKDHAFPGYWRQDNYQEEFIDITDGIGDDPKTEERSKTMVPGVQRVPWWFRGTAYAEIVRQVKRGRLVPLESVWLTEHCGFADAVSGGRDNLKPESNFHSMLDVVRARGAGVTPLPIGGRS